MMKDTFGIRYYALSGLEGSPPMLITGLHPVLTNYALSGLEDESAWMFVKNSRQHNPTTSPEGAQYPSDGCSPSIRLIWQNTTITPPALKGRNI